VNTKFILEFAWTIQICPPIYRNIKFVPEFNRHPLNLSLRPISMLVMPRCRPVCCVVLYTYHPVNYVYKGQFDGNTTNFSCNFSLSIFFLLFFQFYPSYKDQFDRQCNNLGTDLIENFKILGTNLIHFIAGSEYKEVWHGVLLHHIQLLLELLEYCRGDFSILSY